MSRCIMLIRHAEKPHPGRQGVNEAGRPEDGALSVRGWQRAGALVPCFAALADRVDGLSLCRPRHILAAKPTAQHPSTRPADTVRPLAEALGLTVDERWSDEDHLDRVGEALRRLEEPVLVCWRHDHLPALARAIFRGDGVPGCWPGDRFDVTWLVGCDAGRWAFRQFPQRLLAGDSAVVIEPA